MTESNPASKIRALAHRCVSAPPAKSFTWTRDDRSHGRPSRHPVVNSAAPSNIDSKKPYAQTQLSKRSNRPSG
jgi:hypothetical protein